MNEELNENTFWAITSFFNPTNSIRRLQNFKTFRNALNIPLITVEWSWNSGPDFMLNSDDTDILIQRKSDDLLWQKERLLNIAIKELPKNCKYVAWLDCDVLFDNPDWVKLAKKELDQYPLIQPYSSLMNLDSDGNLPPESTRQIRKPIGDPKVFSTLPKDILRHEFKGKGPACGYAWAIRTSLIRKHGLYDACIIGSGDRAIFCAATGRFDDAAAYLQMNNDRFKHYLTWAKPFFDDISGNISWIDGQVKNLWHGEMVHRQYASRHSELRNHNFNPYEDIEIKESECWTWKSPKYNMHKLLIDYFFSRKEDQVISVKIAIVITCFNHAQYTKQAIESLRLTTKNSERYNFQFAVFDDCSTDNTQEVIESIKGINIIYWRSESNKGLTHLWNVAYQKFSDYDYIAIVNNDVIFTPHWCHRILDIMRERNCQIAGPITNGPGHIDKQNIREFISNYEASDNWEDLQVLSKKIESFIPFHTKRINGFCMVFSNKLLHLAQKDRIGEPFDPKNRNFGNEDELQDRLDLNPLIVPASFVFHYKRITIQDRPRAFDQYRSGQKLSFNE